MRFWIVILLISFWNIPAFAKAKSTPAKSAGKGKVAPAKTASTSSKPATATKREPAKNKNREAKADWGYVELVLKRNGFKDDFIRSLYQTYEPKSFQQVVELNVLLFLRKTDYHGSQVSTDAVETVKHFMEANRTALKSAEKQNGVSSSVIASLLWMESRHGVNQGKFHVPSVFIHLLQAPRPDVIEYLQANTGKFAPYVTPKERKKITERTKQKADWALAELKSLQKMHDRDKALVRNLRGSFAGAFGIPQFIPSSYVKWAKAAKKKSTPDLTRPPDAIHSVAFYLKDNGWKKGKEKTYEKALLRYNNSKDYANAILKLASQVDGKDKALKTASNRDPAGKTKPPPKPTPKKSKAKAK